MMTSIGVCKTWWSLIREGKKLVEGRKRSILLKILNLPSGTDPAQVDEQAVVGKRIEIKLDGPDAMPLSILVRVTAVRSYPTLLSFLEKEGFANVLPGIGSLEEAIAEYHKFFSDEEIRHAGGMVALSFQVLS